MIGTFSETSQNSEAENQERVKKLLEGLRTNPHFSVDDWDKAQQELLSRSPHDQVLFIMSEYATGPGRFKIIEGPSKGSRVSAEEIGIPEELAPTIDQLLELIITFRNSPIAIDFFGPLNADKDARRAWRQELNTTFGREFYDFYSFNKLKGNQYFPIMSSADLLGDILAETPGFENAGQAAKALSQTVASEYQDETTYNNKSESEKVTIAHNVGRAADLFLTILSQQKS